MELIGTKNSSLYPSYQTCSNGSMEKKTLLINMKNEILVFDTEVKLNEKSISLINFNLLHSDSEHSLKENANY